MRDPVGILRNLFIRLYGVCFNATLVHHSKKEVILRMPDRVGQDEFSCLFSLNQAGIEAMFGIETPQSFGMVFLDPEGSETSFVWQGEDGSLSERRSVKRYAINIDGIYQGYYRFTYPHELVRDAIALHEAYSVALVAHEIRHELQMLRVIPMENWHRVFPEFRDVNLTFTRDISSRSLSSNYRASLKSYGKRLYKDRYLLDMEVDALSVQIGSFYAWADSRGLRLEERLKRVREVIFAQA